MLPVPTDDEWEVKANPHLRKIVEELSRRGNDIIPLTSYDFTSTKRLIDKKINVILIHWPSSILDMEDEFKRGILAAVSRYFKRRCARKNESFWGRYGLRIFSFLAKKFDCLHLLITKYILEGKIKKLGKVIEISCLPLIWEQHDLGSHHLTAVPYLADLDHKLHSELYGVCSALVVHEKSCIKPIFQTYGCERPYVVAHLGPYLFGPPVSKGEACHRLGIAASGKVIAYLGTARPNRNPANTIASFLRVAGDGDRLIVAGMGVGTYAPGVPIDYRITLLDGFIQPEQMRDIYCAADFVVNDAEYYLTSAVVRAAMTYGVPIIVRPFGSAIDMAREAAIFIDESGIDGALLIALQSDPEKCETLRKEASKRDKERTWETSGKKLDQCLRYVAGNQIIGNNL